MRRSILKLHAIWIRIMRSTVQHWKTLRAVRLLLAGTIPQTQVAAALVNCARECCVQIVYVNAAEAI